MSLVVVLLASCSAESESSDTLPPLVTTTVVVSPTGVPASSSPLAPAPDAAAETVLDTILDTPDSTPDQLDSVSVSRRFGDATVRVVVDDCGDASVGSGFVIDDRHVVSSAQVVRDDPSPEVTLRDGRIMTTTVIGVDTAVGVAVLRAEPGAFAVAASWGDSATVAEGQALTMIGYPAAGDYDVLQVSVRSVADDGTALRVDDGLDDGNGGSPAFADTGAVMGVALTAGGDGGGLLLSATLAAATAASIIAAPTTPMSSCVVGPSTASTPTAPGVPPTIATTIAPTSTTTSTPTSTTTIATTSTVPPRAGTWIMQLASSSSSSSSAAIAEQLERFAAVVPGVQTLRSSDWPKTFATPGLVVFYIGGFANKGAVVSQCNALGLTVPDECLARLLVE